MDDSKAAVPDFRGRRGDQGSEVRDREGGGVTVAEDKRRWVSIFDTPIVDGDADPPAPEVEQFMRGTRRAPGPPVIVYGSTPIGPDRCIGMDTSGRYWVMTDPARDATPTISPPAVEDDEPSD